MKLPELPTIAEGKVLQVSSKDFDIIVDYMSKLADSISTINTELEELKRVQSRNVRHISKLAKILERNYEKN